MGMPVIEIFSLGHPSSHPMSNSFFGWDEHLFVWPLTIYEDWGKSLSCIYLCMYRSPEKITWGHFTNVYGHIHLLASGSIFFRELWWCIVSFLPKNHHLKSGLSINQLSFLQIYFSIKKKNVLEFGKLYVHWKKSFRHFLLVSKILPGFPALRVKICYF